VIEFLNKNNIQPVRDLYIEESDELLINMLSFEDTSFAIKFMIDLKMNSRR